MYYVPKFWENTFPPCCGSGFNLVKKESKTRQANMALKKYFKKENLCFEEQNEEIN
jgi:hypothetical protein